MSNDKAISILRWLEDNYIRNLASNVDREADVDRHGMRKTYDMVADEIRRQVHLLRTRDGMQRTDHADHGWLVEHPDGPSYWCGNKVTCGEWGTDANRAWRFATKKDAEEWINLRNRTTNSAFAAQCKAREHLWLPTAVATEGVCTEREVLEMASNEKAKLRELLDQATADRDAARRHRDDLIAMSRRDAQILRAAGAKDTCIQDMIREIVAQRDGAISTLREHRETFEEQWARVRPYLRGPSEFLRWSDIIIKLAKERNAAVAEATSTAVGGHASIQESDKLRRDLDTLKTERAADAITIKDLQDRNCNLRRLVSEEAVEKHVYGAGLLRSLNLAWGGETRTKFFGDLCQMIADQDRLAARARELAVL